MKLRMLNGTHSSLAYLGYLAGHETIADTVADPVFAAFARHLWREEIIPTLETPEGEDLGRYADALFDRYANPAIRHRTWQIAMDGSQKLPQRILGTLADNRAAGRPEPGLTLAVAAWMRYVGGIDETGARDRRPRPARRPAAGAERRGRRPGGQGRGAARGARGVPGRARGAAGRSRGGLCRAGGGRGAGGGGRVAR